MTYLEFKTFVAAALQRKLDSFVVNGLDLLQYAVNMARKNIERKRDLELAKTVATLEVTLGEFVSLDGAVDADDEPVDIKTILHVQATAVGAPIGYISRSMHQRSLARRLARVQVAELESGLTATVDQLNLVRFGNDVYLSPPNAEDWGGYNPVSVLLDVVRWLPDYSDNDDTDFLLEHCVDYMLLETYRSLQLFIKEDARLQVSDEKLANAWHALVAWDSNLVVGDTDDANLT